MPTLSTDPSEVVPGSDIVKEYLLTMTASERKAFVFGGMVMQKVSAPVAEWWVLAGAVEFKGV